MKRRVLSLILLLLITNISTAQERKPNHVFMEFLGNAVCVSLNYERSIDDYWTLRSGVGIIPSTPSNSLVFPILANRRIYWGRNYFELGVGASIFWAKLDFGSSRIIKTSFFLLTGQAGFCYHITENTTGRLSFTPFTDGENVIPFFGLSFGYSF